MQTRETSIIIMNGTSFLIFPTEDDGIANFLTGPVTSVQRAVPPATENGWGRESTTRQSSAPPIPCTSKVKATSRAGGLRWACRESPPPRLLPPCRPASEEHPPPSTVPPPVLPPCFGTRSTCTRVRISNARTPRYSALRCLVTWTQEDSVRETTHAQCRAVVGRSLTRRSWRNDVIGTVRYVICLCFNNKGQVVCDVILEKRQLFRHQFQYFRRFPSTEELSDEYNLIRKDCSI